MIQRGWGKMIQSKIIKFNSVLKHFQDILSKLSIPITRKLNDTAMLEMYHFIFQNVKNGGQLYHFAPWQNIKHEW